MRRKKIKRTWRERLLAAALIVFGLIGAVLMALTFGEGRNK
jgi:hypothetical protein